MKQEKPKQKLTKEQELIEVRKTKKEDQRQNLRKGFEKNSRFLDNYYNPKVHQKYWNPNGKVKLKKMYNHDDTGLGFNYENKNVMNKMNNIEKVMKIKKQIHFLEFDYMENNEVIVTIEHCSNCNDHQSHTEHINNIYQHFSKILQRVIMLRFPFVTIYLKPIETQITNYSKTKSSVVEDNYLDVRIGAMEIQYAIKMNDEVNITPLHSKLNCGQWPSIYNILNKISTLVPLVHIKCILYDKEEGLVNDNDNNNEDQVDDILPSRFENIKVNLYLVYNDQINAFSEEAMDELDIIYDPRRRHYANCEQMQEQTMKETTSTKVTNSNFYNNRNNHNDSTLLRPSSSKMSFMSNNSKRPNSSYSSHSSNKRQCNNRSILNSTGRPGSSTKNNYSTYTKNLSALETLDNPDTINQMKGKLLSSGYTDNSGGITFQNLPYDSYLIEIESSKNFLTSGSYTRFNKIMQTNEPNEIITINKYFGLLRQIDSYVEVYIYSNDDQNDLELKLIDDAQVYLVRSYECEASLFPPGEDKLLLTENDKIKGRYEIITSPGRIILEVNKIGYEPIKKEITLRMGENKINIELSNE